MRTKKVLLISAAILFLADFTLANSTNTISIALIADKASGLDKSVLVSLLEVELSQKEGIQLLERAAINKILQEQQLSAAGLLDRNTTIKIGKLLRADAFIIISPENQSNTTPETIPAGAIPNKTRVLRPPSAIPSEQNQTEEETAENSQANNAGDLVRVRFVETAHGLRLLDYFEQSDGTNPQEAAARIIQKIQSVISKINQPAGQMIPIGIVDIHRVQLGEQYKMLERTLPVMLSVRLSLEPQIIMLERKDLKVLLDEKLMTEGEDSQFWNSAILIEGYLQPNNGALEMKLQLKQAGGSEIMSLTVPVKPNELSIATVKAANEIIQKLQDSPQNAQWQPELEAEEFYKQGQLLYNHRRYGNAMPLFETAHALQPENVFYTEKVFEIEWITRDHSYGSSLFANIGYHFYTEVELADLVSVFVRQIRDSYEKDIINLQQIYDLWSRFLGSGSIGGYFAEPDFVSSEQIRSINRESRRIWIETFDTALQKELIRSDYPLMNNIVRARLAWISSDDPKELMSNLKKVFNEFVMPPEMGGKIRLNRDRITIFDQAFNTSFVTMLTHLAYFKNKDDFLNLWREYLTELTAVDDPVVQFESCLALEQMLFRQGSEQDRTDAKSYIYKALRVFSEQLQKPDKLSNSNPQKQMNQIIECMKGLRVESDEIIRVWTEFFEPFIEKDDTSTLVSLHPSLLRPNLDNSDTAEQWYRLFEKIAVVLHNHSEDKEAVSALNGIRNQQAGIRNQFPQLNFVRTSPNPSVTMLLKKEDWFAPWRYRSLYPTSVIQVVKQREMLWIAFLLDYRRTDRNIGRGFVDVGIAGIDLEKREMESLWQAKVPIPFLYSGISSPQLTGLEVSNDAIYVAVKNAGIVEFPGSMTKGQEYFKDPNDDYKGIRNLPSGLSNRIIARNPVSSNDFSNKKNQQVTRKPKVYTHETGLPSVLVSSITKDGNTLWVAYGDRGQESGLGIYDPKTGKWESIFCSTLEGEPPFNSGYPYQIKDLKFIEEKKLLFTLDASTSRTSNIGNWLGLWEMDANTYETHFLKTEDTLPFLDDPSLEETDQEKWLIRIREQFGTDSRLSSAAFYNHTFWKLQGKNQIIKVESGQSLEEAQIIDNNILDGEPVLKFVSTPYGLIGIGEGTVGLIETGD